MNKVVLQEMIKLAGVDARVDDLYTRLGAKWDTLNMAYKKILENTSLPEEFQDTNDKNIKVIYKILKETNDKLIAQRLEERKRNEKARKEYAVVYEKTKKLHDEFDTAMEELISQAKEIKMRMDIPYREWQRFKYYFKATRP